MCMQGLLRRNPDERLKAADALEHPWVKPDGLAPETPLSGTVVSCFLQLPVGLQPT